MLLHVKFNEIMLRVQKLFFFYPHKLRYISHKTVLVFAHKKEGVLGQILLCVSERDDKSFAKNNLQRSL